MILLPLLQLALGPLVAAVAAGNCAIIKPPSMSPNFCKIIEELIPKSGKHWSIKQIQKLSKNTDFKKESRVDQKLTQK